MTGTPAVVDVVITTNRPVGYIRDAVASVRAQTFPNWRLVIIDDGSPDRNGLDALAAQIPGSLIHHQPASGASAGRNAGIAAGTGDYIAFLDDDDVWRPDRLALQLAVLNERPDAIGAFSGGWYMDGEGVEFGSGWPAFRGTRTQFLSGEVPLPRITTLLVAREACQAIGGFDPALSLGEDHDFMLRLLQRGEFVGVEQRLVGYRRHDSNVSGASWLQESRAMEAILRKLTAQAQSRGDAHVEALLAEFTRRSQVRAANLSPGRLAHDLRHGRPFHGIAYLSWCLRRAPRSVLSAFAGAMGSRRQA